jgi:hypothetical protein
MEKPYYPDNFTTELDGNAMTVTSKEGEVLAAYDIKHLANKMVNGGRVDAGERAMAGACLLHLIALGKAAQGETSELPDGIYDALTLEDEEAAQAKAVADSVKLNVGAFFAINNADFCDDRIHEALIKYRAGEDWPYAYVKVDETKVYDLIQVNIDGLEVWAALDGIGGYVRKRDLASLLINK